MPYILISTQIRLESGPTIVGDTYSDPLMMKFLNAEKNQQLGNNFEEFTTPDPPRIVLDKLEVLGYRYKKFFDR